LVSSTYENGRDIEDPTSLLQSGDADSSSPLPLGGAKSSARTSGASSTWVVSVDIRGSDRRH
jgi:hypothetical protein